MNAKKGIKILSLVGCLLFSLTSCKVKLRLEHIHDFTNVNRVEATCEKDGNIKYYKCNSCNKYYSDKDGINPISYEDTLIKKLGHEYNLNWEWDNLTSAKVTIKCNRNCGINETLKATISSYTKVEASCLEDGIKEYVASVTYKNQTFTDTKQESISKLGHNISYIERVESTCITNGTIAHYHCDRCDKNFSDSLGQNELTDIFLPLGDHSYINGTCKYCNDKLETINITGKVYIADNDNTDVSDNLAANGVSIKIEGTSEDNLNNVSYTSTSLDDGTYLINDTLTKGTYKITYSLDGYQSVTKTAKINELSQYTTLESVFLIPSDIDPNKLGKISGTAFDSVSGLGISNITINIYKGFDNTSNDKVSTIQTSTDGTYITSDLEAGYYTLEFVDNRNISDENDRYVTKLINVSVSEDNTSKNINAILIDSKTYNSGSLRVVLTWNNINTIDLDSFMLFGTSSSSTTVSSAHKSDDGVSLDADSFTTKEPLETMTISSFKTDYTYRYYIQNYTDAYATQYKTTNLSTSGAKAEITLKGETYTVNVPYGEGVYWDVFSYSATSGLQITSKIIQYTPKI